MELRKYGESGSGWMAPLSLRVCGSCDRNSKEGLLELRGWRVGLAQGIPVSEVKRFP